MRAAVAPAAAGALTSHGGRRWFWFLERKRGKVYREGKERRGCAAAMGKIGTRLDFGV